VETWWNGQTGRQQDLGWTSSPPRWPPATDCFARPRARVPRAPESCWLQSTLLARTRTGAHWVADRRRDHPVCSVRSLRRGGGHWPVATHARTETETEGTFAGARIAPVALAPPAGRQAAVRACLPAHSVDWTLEQPSNGFWDFEYSESNQKQLLRRTSTQHCCYITPIHYTACIVRTADL
jgi:hypothetical protein